MGSRREKPRSRHHGLNQQKRQEIKEVFDLFDTDQSGTDFDVDFLLVYGLLLSDRRFDPINLSYRQPWREGVECRHEVLMPCCLKDLSGFSTIFFCFTLNCDVVVLTQFSICRALGFEMTEEVKYNLLSSLILRCFFFLFPIIFMSANGLLLSSSFPINLFVI